MTKERREESTMPIPEDLLLYEILPRVHIKSLIRFKSVCKKWFGLITQDRIFSNRHYQMSRTDDSLNFIHQVCRDRHSLPINIGLTVISIDKKCEFMLSIPCPCSSIRSPIFLSSSNGLICAICWDCGDLFVANPITKCAERVPSPRRISYAAIAFDPSIPVSCYTIICPIRLGPQTDLEQCGFEVFSSKTRMWRSSKARSRVFRLCCITEHNVFIGGRIYWLDMGNIRWLDFEDRDVAGFVELPFENKIVNNAEIGDCNGELSYSTITEGVIKIWLLRTSVEFEFDWVKIHEVKLEGIIKDNLDFISPFSYTLKLRNRSAYDAFMGRRLSKVLPYQGGGVVLFWVDIDGIGKIFACYLRTRELKKMSTCGVEYICLPVRPFKGTLLQYPS